MNKLVDFSNLHTTMQRYVDDEILPGMSHVLMHNGQVIDSHCCGYADKELMRPLNEKHLFRVFSNTKLITTCAVMLLIEQGQLSLSDPLEKFVPTLANRQILNAGAKEITDTRPSSTPMTVRHLLTHSAGLSYGFLNPGAVLSKGYTARNILNPLTPLSEMMERLAELPLAYEPGQSWEYSVATDVLGHVVEIVSGMSLDQFFASKIFTPLGMTDTFFVVPQDKRSRLAEYYQGVDWMRPNEPGLTRADTQPYPGAYVRAVPRLSGGGGLVSSLSDTTRLLQCLQDRRNGLLSAPMLDQMMQNQLPPEQAIRFLTGDVKGKGFGYGGAVTMQPSSLEASASVGEFQWGGIGGTHWWISPNTGLSGVLMTQRVMAFWNPYFFDVKRAAYQSMGY